MLAFLYMLYSVLGSFFQHTTFCTTFRHLSACTLLSASLRISLSPLRLSTAQVTAHPLPALFSLYGARLHLHSLSSHSFLHIFTALTSGPAFLYHSLSALSLRFLHISLFSLALSLVHASFSPPFFTHHFFSSALPCTPHLTAMCSSPSHWAGFCHRTLYLPFWWCCHTPLSLHSLPHFPSLSCTHFTHFHCTAHTSLCLSLGTSGAVSCLSLWGVLPHSLSFSHIPDSCPMPLLLWVPLFLSSLGRWCSWAGWISSLLLLSHSFAASLLFFFSVPYVSLYHCYISLCSLLYITQGHFSLCSCARGDTVAGSLFACILHSNSSYNISLSGTHAFALHHHTTSYAFCRLLLPFLRTLVLHFTSLSDIVLAYISHASGCHTYSAHSALSTTLYILGFSTLFSLSLSLYLFSHSHIFYSHYSLPYLSLWFAFYVHSRSFGSHSSLSFALLHTLLLALHHCVCSSLSLYSPVVLLCQL